MKFFFGEGCRHFAGSFLKSSDCELSRFPNGENRVWIKENCEGETVAIFQNFCAPVDQNIMQFCLMVDAISRLHPKKIIGVIPWLGYAKQDKVFRKGEPLAAEVVAKIVSSLKLDQVILLDVHHQNVKTFFSIPVLELSAVDLFIEEIKKIIKQNEGKKIAICSPDQGALSRNQSVANKLGLPLFVIEKERDLVSGKVSIKGIRENGKSDYLRTTDYVLRTFSIVMFDDMILSGGTLIKDAEYIKNMGVSDIYFFATHLDPTSKTFVNLEKAPVKQIFVTDSLNFSAPQTAKILPVSIDYLIVEELNKSDN